MHKLYRNISVKKMKNN